jgi:hypothetical protein
VERACCRYAEPIAERAESSKRKPMRAFRGVALAEKLGKLGSISRGWKTSDERERGQLQGVKPESCDCRPSSISKWSTSSPCPVLLSVPIAASQHYCSLGLLSPERHRNSLNLTARQKSLHQFKLCTCSTAAKLNNPACL